MELSDEDRLYLEFLDMVTEADAISEAREVTNLRRHAAANWKASVEFLRRRHPDRWGDRARIEHDLALPLEAEGQLDLEGLSDEEIDDLNKTLEATLKKAEPS
jgi:hypothetical protein